VQTREEIIEAVRRLDRPTWDLVSFVDILATEIPLGRKELTEIVREARPDLDKPEPPGNSQKTARKQVFTNIVNTAFVPIRKEDWIESEDYPGIWVNSSGEVMDGATRKVRTLCTGFNPKTRKFSTRVWIDQERKYAFHQSLMIERNRLKESVQSKQPT
jgi:hypothetical protein